MIKIGIKKPLSIASAGYAKCFKLHTKAITKNGGQACWLRNCPIKTCNHKLHKNAEQLTQTY